MTKTVKAPLTLRELLFDLARDGFIEKQAFPQIEAHLIHGGDRRSEPWFVKVFLALGAWVAAICFVACLGIADLFGDEAWQNFCWAFGFLAVATLMRNLTRNVFTHQLALALSAAGHFFAMVGAADIGNSSSFAAALAITTVLLCAGLYPLYRDSVHRFLSCALAAGCLTGWICDAGVWPLLHVQLLIKVAAIGGIFMYRPDLRVLRPAGYALALSVPASMLLVLLPEDILTMPWWPANAILVMALIWLYKWIVGSWAAMSYEPLLLAALTTAGLACVTTPGVLAALGLMVLGYARRDRHLLGIGILFFPIFIVVFYYEWQISLLVKSWIMAGSGAVLIAARQYLKFRNWAQESLA